MTVNTVERNHAGGCAVMGLFAPWATEHVTYIINTCLRRINNEPNVLSLGDISHVGSAV